MNTVSSNSMLLLLLGGSGLALGSFLNVVIHRLPRGMSLVRPGSSCPRCGAPIRFWDNIPVLSYLLLVGRCRSCRARISARYPAIEVLAACLTVICGLRHAAPLDLAACTFFALTLLACATTDLERGVIPDPLTFFLVGLGLLFGALTPGGIPQALLGIATGGGGLLAIRAAYRAVRKREGLGPGDVKLLAGIGAFLGWKGAVASLLVGSILGSVYAVGLCLAGKADRATALAFGPFLAAGALYCALFPLTSS